MASGDFCIGRFLHREIFASGDFVSGDFCIGRFLHREIFDPEGAPLKKQYIPEARFSHLHPSSIVFETRVVGLLRKHVGLYKSKRKKVSVAACTSDPESVDARDVMPHAKVYLPET